MAIPRRFNCPVPRRSITHRLPGLIFLSILLIAIVAPLTVVNSQIQTDGGQSGQRRSSGFPILPETANPHPDKNRILEDTMNVQLDQKRLTMINVARQKEMTSDTAKILILATEIKTSAAKSNDTLSVAELRKVEQIEKLAHAVRDTMRATVTAPSINSNTPSRP